MKNKTLFVISLCILVSILLLLSTNTTQRRTSSVIGGEFESTEEGTQALYTLSANKYRVKKGQPLTVFLKTKSDKPILATDVILSFDKSLLKVTSLNPGSYFEKPITLFKKIDNLTGTLAYSLAALQSSSTTGTMLSVTLMPLTQGSAAVTISPRSLASFKSGQKARLQIANNLYITITR